MFASDRDLLVYEPRLFDEVAFASQTVFVSGEGEVTGGGLVLTVRGAAFDALGVGAGWVAVVGGVAVEVIERQDAETLLVSRLRASAAGAGLPLVEGTGLSVRIATFRPQIGVVHQQVITALGLDGAGGAAPDESGVVNPGALVRVEALGALHLVFGGAAALVGSDSILWQKAQSYLARFGAERPRAAAVVDVDGDGVGDVIRRMNVMQFVRR